MAKTRMNLGDLADYLFAEIDRLDAAAPGDEMEAEIKRADALGGISKGIIDAANVVLRSMEFKNGVGMVAHGVAEMSMPALLSDGEPAPSGAE